MVSISELNQNFKIASEGIQNLYEIICKSEHPLYPTFMVEMNHNELWDKYMGLLNKYDMNPYYHENPYHQCSACHRFFNSYGNIVYLYLPADTTSVEDSQNKINILSIFGTKTNTIYDKVFGELNEYIINKPIVKAYFPTKKVAGVPSSIELSPNGSAISHQHYYLRSTGRLIDKTSEKKLEGKVYTNRELLERTFNTIPLNPIRDVLDLINDNNLYRGEEFRGELVKLKKDIEYFNKCSEKEKELYLWYQASNSTDTYSHLINTVMGELLQNLIHDSVEVAVGKYESMVAPSNYQRPKPIVTEQMIGNAKKTIDELGFLNSLGRRHATLDDIPVSKVLWSNKKKHDEDLFENLKKDAVHKPLDIKNRHIPVLTFKEFLDKIKTESDVELYMDSRHSKNFMTITTAVNSESKPLFKWNSHLSWAYTGNLADSDIKSNVLKAGGNVEGVLRFSIQWNDGVYYSTSDLDAHCIEPDRNEIYYANKLSPTSSGFLDVDIINPQRNVPAVENITFPKLEGMENGKYLFFVHNFTNNRGNVGFNAEIEYDGKIRKYEYNHPLPQNEKVPVAEVTLNDGKFGIVEKIPSTVDNKKIWNIPLNSFQPITIITTSPNSWDNDNTFTHIFFILKDCICDEELNGYYNEFLTHELREHKKVMALLANKTKIEPTENQISGVGFTRDEEIIVKIDGNLYKVKL